VIASFALLIPPCAAGSLELILVVHLFYFFRSDYTRAAVLHHCFCTMTEAAMHAAPRWPTGPSHTLGRLMRSLSFDELPEPKFPVT
jgi:hypothetical protein